MPRNGNVALEAIRADLVRVGSVVLLAAMGYVLGALTIAVKGIQ